MILSLRRRSPDREPSTWTQLVAAADRVRIRCPDTDLVVGAERRRGIGLMTEGLAAWNQDVDEWKPVRERRWFRRGWTPLQTVRQAEIGTEWFVRSWPNGPHR